MKIKDIEQILKDFINQTNSYTSILIDGCWGSGKTTQVRDTISECDGHDVIYVSLFGIKSVDELGCCYGKIGKVGKTIGNIATIGLSVIPFVGGSISTALSNVLDQYSDAKVLKKKKIFIFDDLERVDSDMSLVSLLGFFNTLMLNGCKILCLSALSEIKDEEKREGFDRFTEKAFDRVYHIDEEPDEVYIEIFKKYNVGPIDRVTGIFNGNIRLAKRTALLYQNAVDSIKSFKENEAVFDKTFSNDELLYGAAVVIKILYSDYGEIKFTDKQVTSHTYMLLEDYSSYFGPKISQRYIYEFLEKRPDTEQSFSKKYSLVKDLIYLEMFSNSNHLKDDCRVSVIDQTDEEKSLLTSNFYCLNDFDKKRFVELIDKELKSKRMPINTGLITMLSQVNSYSDLVFSKVSINEIIKETVRQSVDGNDAVFKKIKELHSYNPSCRKEDMLKVIYERAKKLIDNTRIKNNTELLLGAYNNKDYVYLTDFYYKLSEGNLYVERNDYVKFTTQNKFLLPNLEKSITSQMWSFCHQISRYCKLVGIEKKFINFLKEYVKKFPDEKSLKDKAYALVHYNIDESIKITDLFR